MIYARDGSLGVVNHYIGFIHALSPWATSGPAVFDFLSNKKRKVVSVDIAPVYNKVWETRGKEHVRVGVGCYHPFAGGEEWEVDREKDREGRRTFLEWGVRRISDDCRRQWEREKEMAVSEGPSGKGAHARPAQKSGGEA